MINIFEPQFTEDDIQAVTDVLRSGWLNEHDKTKEFERRFAEYVGTEYAVASSSGTAALFLALKAAGVDEFNKVAVPDYTAIGTIRAIQLSGAWAIIVDVDDKGNINVEEAKRANAGFVIAVHNNGYPCDIDELANHFGEDYVIEDASNVIAT